MMMSGNEFERLEYSSNSGLDGGRKVDVKRRIKERIEMERNVGCFTIKNGHYSWAER